ncbi:MAG: hypothetical protein JWN48_2425 [Myxococcaceae bacterium]|nr:hypothetical protein [Myxococcaceae bacterium]
MRQQSKARWSMGSMEACLAVVLLSAGCGGEDDSISTEADGGSSTGKAGSSCPERYVTQQCSCDNLKGSQFCSASGWTECECQLPGGGTQKGSSGKPGQSSNGTPAGNLRTDIKFDWERTPAVQGSCEPGYYEGTFSGIYASQITFVNAPIPVAAVSIPGKPGLSFTLTKAPGSGEKLEIKDGVMDGLADGAFPFKGTLTGTLDCETLKFDAILDGYYSLGVDGVGQWKFKGPLVSDYDKATRSLVNATWNVLEYDPPPANYVTPAGGQGTWSASWLHP